MIWISETQEKQIQEMVSTLGRTKSEIIRQAISEFVAKFFKEEQEKNEYKTRTNHER